MFAEEEAALLGSAAASPQQLEAMVEQRISGDPLEHVVGWADFCGQRLAVDSGVFVPRRRTELLARHAAAAARDGAVVVDLCCGTGAVGAVVAAAHAGVELHAVDVDAAAVRCAAGNLAPLDGRVHEGDLYAALPMGLRRRVDVVTANAPYVPTDAVALMPAEARLHESRVALDGGTDGLDVVRRVVAGAGNWLAPGGALLVESSAAQADQVCELFRDTGLTPRVASDDELDATVVSGRGGT